MERHTVSLELAKQLKETGWKKETEFWWAEGTQFGEHRIETKEQLDKKFQEYKSSEKADYNYLFDGCMFYPAPLATEILEEIKGKVSIQITYSKEVGLRITDLKSGIYFTDTLPNALAKMWLYLKKEGKV